MNLVHKRESLTWNQIVLLGYVCIIIIPIAQSFLIGDTVTSKQDSELIKTQEAAPSGRCDISGEDIYRIHCYSITPNDNLTALLEETVEEFENNTGVINELNIAGLEIANGIMDQNWIVTTSFRVISLNIVFTTIHRLENAFKGVYAFEELQSLRFDAAIIGTIDESSFEGLKHLTSLNLALREINVFTNDCLRPVAPTLEFIKFGAVKKPPIGNFTGSVLLPNMIAIDLTLNNLSSINPNSFAQIPGCKNLTLSYGNIENIPCGTFEKMTSLKMLDLTNNLLTTLDPCIFGDELLNNLPEESLWIDDNEWDCNCELNWLKELKLKKIVADNATCASHDYLLFEEVEFCEEKLAIVGSSFL
ncbi:trophoblast glycoprotein-like [Arctopsyche grandis]|uniref:trophoblast glycoprotein-like n=1 Tax=Arctopsyche grandis TaxID=121162 RepID=UPI00406D82CA